MANLNEKIKKVKNEIELFDDENMRLDKMINKEEEESYKLSCMLNYLMSKA